MQGTMSTQSSEGTQNTWAFKTKDGAGQVLTYYESQLKSAGFTIALSTKTDQGGMLTAEDGPKKRMVMVTAGSNDSGGGTEGSLTTIEKK